MLTLSQVAAKVVIKYEHVKFENVFVKVTFILEIMLDLGVRQSMKIGSFMGAKF